MQLDIDKQRTLLALAVAERSACLLYTSDAADE